MPKIQLFAFHPQFQHELKDEAQKDGLILQFGHCDNIESFSN